MDIHKEQAGKRLLLKNYLTNPFFCSIIAVQAVMKTVVADNVSEREPDGARLLRHGNEDRF